MIVSIPAFPATFTICDTTHFGPAALPFLILVIESLTMSVSLMQDTMLTRDNTDQNGGWYPILGA